MGVFKDLGKALQVLQHPEIIALADAERLKSESREDVRALMVIAKRLERILESVDSAGEVHVVGLSPDGSAGRHHVVLTLEQAQALLCILERRQPSG